LQNVFIGAQSWLLRRADHTTTRRTARRHRSSATWKCVADTEIVMCYHAACDLRRLPTTRSSCIDHSHRYYFIIDVVFWHKNISDLSLA
jgi:hypothetical protein